jgi:hypothetical protein
MQSAPFVSKNLLSEIKWHAWSVCADFISTASRLGSVNIPDDVQFTSMAWVIKREGVSIAYENGVTDMGLATFQHFLMS